MKVRKKLGLFLALISITLVIYSSIIFVNTINLYNSEKMNDPLEFEKLIPRISSTYSSPITIDGDAEGVGAHNWTWAVNQGYCTGSGSEDLPFLISGDTFYPGSYLTIINSHESYFKVENCTFYNTGTVGAVLHNVSNGFFIKNDFSYFIEYGIDIDDCEGIAIIDNYFNTIEEVGIRAQDCINLNISDNFMIEDYAGFPFYTDAIRLVRTNYTYVLNNDLSGMDYNTAAGVKVIQGHHNTIMYNEIYNTEESPYGSWDHYGIFLDNCFENNISQNTVYNTDYGIVLSNSDLNNRVYENTIHHSTQGIRLVNSEENTVFENIEYNNTDGIHLRYSDNNIILGNTLNDNENGIYLFESEENNVFNNNATLNTDVGILLQYNSSNNIIFMNRLISNYYGIRIWGVENNTIFRNTAQDNNVGISIYQCYHFNNITDNTITSDGIGIGLLDSQNTFISYNLLTYNGINLADSHNNTIYKNNITECNYGMDIVLSDDNQILVNTIKNSNIGIYFYIANFNNVTGNYFICNDEYIREDDSTNNIYNNYYEECPPQGDGSPEIPGYHPLIYIGIVFIIACILVIFLKKKQI